MPHLKIRDHRLEYEWHGPGPDRAPTLVFLHEGLGCVAMWKDFPAQVAASTGYGALVYSARGMGVLIHAVCRGQCDSCTTRR